MATFDIAYDWRKARGRYCPHISEIIEQGRRVSGRLGKHDVLMRLDPRQTALLVALRRWLKENSRTCEMRGRFAVTRRSIHYIGVVFRFTTLADAMMFKIRWYDGFS